MATGEALAGPDLYFLRARYCDPATGRFIGRDPVEFEQRCAYAECNPLGYSDPTGLASLDVWKGSTTSARRAVGPDREPMEPMGAAETSLGSLGNGGRGVQVPPLLPTNTQAAAPARAPLLRFRACIL